MSRDMKAYIHIEPRPGHAPIYRTDRAWTHYTPTRITDAHGALIATPQTWTATVTYLWGRTRCTIWTGTAREPETGRMIRWTHHETDHGGMICRVRPA